MSDDPPVEPVVTDQPPVEPPPAPPTEPPVEPVVPSFSETWRADYANGDEKVLARLERYNTPDDVFNAMFSLQNRLRSGELKSVLRDGASAEEAAKWREENGVPATAAEYSTDLGGGMVVGENDRQAVDSYLEAMHAVHATQEQITQGLHWHYDNQQHVAQVRAEADAKDADSAGDLLNKEWGGDYVGNLNRSHGLLALAPDGFSDRFINGRTKDGTALANDPDFWRWMSLMARKLNPSGTLTPGTGSDQIQGIETEIASIEKKMGTREYIKDEKMQARVRELYAEQERLKA